MFRSTIAGLAASVALCGVAIALGSGVHAAGQGAAGTDIPFESAQASQQRGQQAQARNPLPADASAVQVPDGYELSVLVDGLNYPSDITFAPNGEIYVAEVGGHTYGTAPDKAPPPRILQVMPDGSTKVIYDKQVPMEAIREAPLHATGLPEGLIPPLLGITWHDGKLYVSMRTRMATLDPKTGEFNVIIEGIPSWGEFHGPNKARFGPDGKVYFTVSTQGNSGNVDGHWIKVIDVFNKPDAHENPCEDVAVTGLDFMLKNTLTPEEGDMIQADVYAPLGVDTEEGQVIEGQEWCHGAVYRANADGSDPEVVAWGLRSNFGYDFSPDGRLFATQNSGNIMEPRPIYNDWEPVYEIEEGAWYGWPDYYSSIPITDPRFREPRFAIGDIPSVAGAQPFEHHFALTEETRRKLLDGLETPPAPVAHLPVHSAAEGMIFGREEFGLLPNEVLVAEFGSIIAYYKDRAEWPGFRVQRLDLQTGEADDFLINKGGKPGWVEDSGGLRRPLQLNFGPDGALYVVDFGVITFDPKGLNAQPGTGVIWKVRRTR